MIIEFTFNKNTSTNYTKVVNLCSKIGVFIHENGDRNILTMTERDIFSKWDVFNYVFHYIKRWTSFDIRIDGELVIDYKMKSDFFYSVQDVRNCYINYLRAEYKNEYCDSHWGCHKLKAISFHIYGLRKWFHYGHFISDTVWQVDKNALKSIMYDESKMRYLELCPCFNYERIDRTLNNIPNEIDISLDNEWVIEYKKVFLNGKFVSVPHTIRFQEDYSPAECKIIEINKLEISGDLTDDQANDLIDEYLKRKKEK